MNLLYTFNSSHTYTFLNYKSAEICHSEIKDVRIAIVARIASLEYE